MLDKDLLTALTQLITQKDTAVRLCTEMISVLTHAGNKDKIFLLGPIFAKHIERWNTEFLGIK